MALIPLHDHSRLTYDVSSNGKCVDSCWWFFNLCPWSFYNVLALIMFSLSMVFLFLLYAHCNFRMMLYSQYKLSMMLDSNPRRFWCMFCVYVYRLIGDYIPTWFNLDHLYINDHSPIWFTFWFFSIYDQSQLEHGIYMIIFLTWFPSISYIHRLIITLIHIYTDKLACKRAYTYSLSMPTAIIFTFIWICMHQQTFCHDLKSNVTACPLHYLGFLMCIYSCMH